MEPNDEPEVFVEPLTEEELKDDEQRLLEIYGSQEEVEKAIEAFRDGI